MAGTSCGFSKVCRSTCVPRSGTAGVPWRGSNGRLDSRCLVTRETNTPRKATTRLTWDRSISKGRGERSWRRSRPFYKSNGRDSVRFRDYGKLPWCYSLL